MSRYRCAALAASILSLTLVARSAPAAVFEVPPVTINALTHRITFGGHIQDGITIPGPGYTSSGFTTNFATGDVVRVRVQAPPGKMFRVHSPTGGTSMSFNVHWICINGISSHFNTAVVTFENLNGVAPTNTYQLVLANEIVVEAWFDYTVPADFEFTAFVADIIVDQPLASTMRTYGDVESYSTQSIFAGAVTTDPSFRAMEIVDIPVPVRASSWGRIKSLYR